MKYAIVRSLILLLVIGLISPTAEARRRRTRRFLGPPLTHPVILWARTLSESHDLEAKKVAAFKLSQYSQTIYQVEAVNAIVSCTKHPDFQLRVLCTKALSRAGNSSKKDLIVKTLIDIFDSEPKLRCTVIRALTMRNEASPAVIDKFLSVTRESRDSEVLVTLLLHLETIGSSSPKVISAMTELYAKTTDEKVRRAVAKVLAAHGNGSESALDLLAKCASPKDDTPLTLICLGGLQQQGKNDPRTWAAIEKSLESNDADVQLAVVDLIGSLTENPNPKIVDRLLALLEDVDDDDLQEKIVLSLGVVGDKSDKIAESLAKLLQSAESFEGTRIAAALTLAKQTTSVAKPKEALAKCIANEKSETLRSACQLGANEINSASRTVASP